MAVNKNIYPIERVMKVVSLSGGSPTKAARILNTGRQQIYRLYKAYPEFKEAMKEARQELLETVEDMLIDDVLNGEAHHSERIFFMKTKMVAEGYTAYSQKPKELIINNITDQEQSILDKALEQVYGNDK